MSIKDNIEKFRYIINKKTKESPSQNPVTFLVATKYANTEQTKAVIESGIRVIGENRVQEAVEKQKELGTTSAEWHLIGPLQSNKINKALAAFTTFQSLDRLSIMEKLNTKAKEKTITIKGYIQLNIASDPNKVGFTHETLLEHEEKIFSFSNISIEGIMVVTPLEKDESKTREHYKNAYRVFDSLKHKHPTVHVLSMGMSRDYDIAIEEGATCVRIGRAVFSEESQK